MSHTLRYKQHDFELADGEFLVGRAVTCHLSLDDPMVSRTHARLAIKADAVEIEDLGSRNGVKVNGERIQGIQELKPGDEITIGSQQLVLLPNSEAGRGLGSDNLVQSPGEVGPGFGLMGALADKALGLGRGDEAERLMGSVLDQLLESARVGQPAPAETLDRGIEYALRLAGATQSPRWTDFVFRLYSVLRRPCPAPVVDELYTLLRKVQKPTAGGLVDYLEVLRSLELGPADRFLMKRIEGLEALIRAR